METCFNYCESGQAFFSSDEQKWVNRIRRLKEEHPNEVEILKEPEDNDGCIYCKLPSYVLKLKFKQEREITEEQRQVLRDRLAFARSKRASTEIV